MADEEEVSVPLYPSDAAYKAGIAAVNLNNYGQGVDIGRKLGNPITEAFTGLNEGLNDYEARANSASTRAYRDQQLEQNIETAPLRSANIEAETQYLQEQAALRKAQAANLPAETRYKEAKAALDTKELQVKEKELSLKSSELELKNNALNEEKIATQEAISAVTPPVDRPVSVEARVAQAEKQFNAIVDGAIQDPNEALGRKQLGVNRQVTQGLMGIYTDALATGNPQLIERSKKLVRRLEQEVTQAKILGSKKENAFSLIPPDPAAEAANEMAWRTGGVLGGSPSSSTDVPTTGVPGTGDIVAGAPNVAPLASPATPPTEAPIPRGRDLTFPSETGEYIPTLNEELPNKPKTAVAEQLRSIITKTPEEISARAAEIVRAEGIQDEYTRTLRTNQLEKRLGKWSISELTNVEKAAGVKELPMARGLAQQAGTVLQRMQDLERAAPGTIAELKLGTTGSFKQKFDTLDAQFSTLLGYGSSSNPEATEAINDIKRTLDGLAGPGVLKLIKDSGFESGRLADKEAEFDRYAVTLTSPTATLEQNIAALDGYQASAKSIEYAMQVKDAALKLGLDAQATIGLIDQYLLENPSTVDTGTVNGQPRKTANMSMETGYDFVARARKLRLPNGRRVAAPPTSAGDVGSILSNTVDKKDISATEGFDTDPNEMLLSSEGEYVKKPARSLDIPTNLPDGANRALVEKVIQVESNGNPKAVSSTGAKGLMQLTNSTGKMLWKSMGWEGEYDPFDPVKNVKMGTEYMNGLLDAFNGNTVLALAAYNVGPGTVDAAAAKALRYQDSTDWNVIKEYLPEDKTFKVDGKDVTINLRKQASDYVDKIMGTPKTLAKERKDMLEEDKGTAIASLPPELQTIASENINEAQIKELNKVKDITDPAEAEGTFIGDFASALISELDPRIKTAEAEGLEEYLLKSETGAAKPAAKPQKPLEIDPADPIMKLSMAIYKDPKILYAAAMGISKGVMIGWDDEAAIAFRQGVQQITSMVTGEAPETPEESRQFVRGKKDALALEYPLITAGAMVAGSVGGGTTRLLGMAGKGGKMIAGAAGELPVVGKAVISASKIAGELATNVAKGAGVVKDTILGKGAAVVDKAVESKAGQKATELITRASIPAAKGVQKVAGSVKGSTAKKISEKAGRVVKIAEPRLVEGRIKSGFKQAGRGALVGGAATAAYNFSESEGGAKKRLQTAMNADHILTGMGLGTLIGGVAGAAFKQKVAPVTPEQAATIAFSEAAEGASIAEAKALREKLASGKYPDASIADELLAGKFKGEVGRGANTPGVSATVLEKSEPILDEAKDAAIGVIRGATGREVTAAEATTKVAGRVAKGFEKTERAKRSFGKRAYNEARRAMPKESVATHRTVKDADGNMVDIPITSKSGIPVENMIKEGNVPKQVPVFKSEKLDVLYNNNDEVRAAFDELPDTITHHGAAPWNSFDSVQAVKQSLYRKMTNPEGGNQQAYKKAYEKLVDAVYDPAMKGGAEYQAADRLWAAFSTKLDESYGNKLLTQLSNVVDKNGSIKDLDKFTKSILDFDVKELSALQRKLGAGGKQDLADMIQGHLENQINALGTRAAGKSVTLPDITKGNMPQKMELLLGKEAADEITNSYTQLRNVVDTANRTTGDMSAVITKEVQDAGVNILRNAGSDTASAVALGGMVAAGGGGPFTTLAALRRGGGAVAGVAAYLKRNPEQATAAIQKELMKMVYTNPQAGVKLLDDLIAASEGTEVFLIQPIKNQFLELVQKLTAPGVATVTQPGILDKPDTGRARNKKRIAQIKQTVADREARKRKPAQIRITPNRN